MAFLKFRGNTTSPTKPGSTTAANAPLTNAEIDGNFASLNDGKLENSGTANHTGNVTFGNQTSSQGFGAGAYLNTNINKLVFRPSLDVDGSSRVDSSDSLRLLQWIAGSAISTPFNGAPYVIQHADKTATGIAMYHSEPLAWSVGTDQNPAMIITAGGSSVAQYARIGGAQGTDFTSFTNAVSASDIALKASTVAINSTTASTTKLTGALIVGGGVGISGAVYADSAVLTNALPAASGGTGTGTYTTGDILYASGTNTLSKLSAGSNGQLLTLSGGVPTWTTVSGGATLSDDTTTASNAHYLTFTTLTSGTMTSAKVSSTKLYFNPSTGTLNSTDFNSLSDVRFKKDLVKIQNALSKVRQLTGYTFTMIESGKRGTGLLAQDAEKVSPESVSGTEDRMTLNYDSLLGLIVEAIKEIDDKLTSIEQRLDK